ncbi:MAG: LysM peptidoglycan-binding domain-containing protein [Akkermansiaceae bacterium]
MKTLALTSTVFVLTAASALAQQSDLEFLRARADAHERKISQLEREINLLKANQIGKQHPKAVPVSPTPAAMAGEYIVKKGDMLGRIAKRHNTTVAAIKRANGLRNDNIRIGQKLRIPGAGDKLAKSKTAPSVQKDGPLKVASTHVVKPGETFYSIARKHDVSITSLMLANPRIKPSGLQVGQKISVETSARPASETRSSSSRKVASKPKSLPKPKQRTQVTERADPPKPKPAKTKEVVRNAAADREPVSEPARSESEIRTITVHKQITYGQFASKHGASTNQLNELNGLSLSKNTMLAIGSELYVPKD